MVPVVLTGMVPEPADQMLAWETTQSGVHAALVSAQCSAPRASGPTACLGSQMMGQCCCTVRMWRCLCSLLCLSPCALKPPFCLSHLCLSPLKHYQVCALNPAIASPGSPGTPLPQPSLLPQSFHCKRGLGTHPCMPSAFSVPSFHLPQIVKVTAWTPGCSLWSQEEQQAIGQDHWPDFPLCYPHAESENLK